MMFLVQIIGLLCGLLWWGPVEATTIPAVSCSGANVTTAFGLAVTGDTVTIPGGTCNWTSPITVGSKSITIQGAGAGTVTQCAVALQTTFTCVTQDSTNTSGLISWTLISTGVPKITGITFDGGTAGGSCSGTTGLLNIDGDSASWTFMNNRVVSRRCNGMVINGYVRGVDTSYHENRSTQFSVFLHHPKWGGGSNTCPNYAGDCGDRSWAAATNFGSAGFYVFEDCTFERVGSAAQYMTDGWKGQRMVVRFCTLLNGTINDHGTDSAGRVRGARAKEVYANAYTFDALSTSAAMSARGGTALFWGNEATVSGSGGLTRMADANQYRLLVNPDHAIECSYWGCADDSANNNFDQGAGTGNGYAAMDQVGRGIGSLITGDEYTAGCTDPTHPAKCGVTPVGWPTQALEPIYAWDLNINGVNSPLSPNDFSTGNYVVENREFYTEGSLNGVRGSGLRSARPATCTTGQAYWSADGGGNWNTSSSNPKGVQRNGADGALDKCTATNTWTNDWYTPYTYPHPLQGAADTTPPAIPTGVTVVKVSR